MTIDVKGLQKKLESIIRASKVRCDVTEREDEKRYTISTSEAKLIITIGSRWIGYDLTVAKHVFGVEFGMAVDTDNYPLQGEYAKIALDVYAEAEECLKGLLEHRILIGRDKGGLILAVPLPGGEYSLKRFLPKKWLGLDRSETAIMSFDDLSKLKDVRKLSRH